MNAASVGKLIDDLKRRAHRTTDDMNLATLVRLVQRLEHATADRLPSVISETLVARRIMLAGCSVEAETPTPTGRTCDFRLWRDGVRLHVHVKRLDAPVHTPPTIPSILRGALRNKQPVRVGIRWDPQLNTLGLRRLARAFAGFLQEGVVGESLSVRDASQRELGNLRIDRPAEKLELRVDRPDRHAVLERIDRLLQRAAQQCMPGQANAIMVVGSCPHDADLLDEALLGRFVARWDQSPRRGERQAFGRDNSGLWSKGSARDAGLACWCTLQGLDGIPRLSAGEFWLRSDRAPTPESAALARAALLRPRAG